MGGDKSEGKRGRERKGAFFLQSLHGRTGVNLKKKCATAWGKISVLP